MKRYLVSVILSLFIFQSCINNYNQEELRIYSEIANTTFIYDSSRSELDGLVIDSIDSLHLQLKKDSTFHFVSLNPKFSNITGSWRLSEFPEIQFWIFKVKGDSSEQWNSKLEIKVNIDSVESTIAFKRK
ncbi:MAG: hypothetical protein KBF42_04440 [Chitinophagales bacterium]|jgi:hypothetical protein|nr:hypothetical protein [Bacteroidota bacterium]MBK7567945.1 hypothetical protein [Bacteroidota bacterium]MBP9220608.1 hypothetical protein [Chitinophagales bacterium]MBP9795487.1 hypothetical protein [Chitinophagales bacterium]